MIIKVNGYKFIWKKEWVRPYESPFSVFRNFCRVNVMNGSQLFRMLGGSYSNCERFNPEIITWECSTAHSHLELNHIMPDLTLPHNIMENPEDIYSKTVRICPKCMKENYHSFLHNFKGIKKCPFHPDADIVDTDVPYHIQQGIKYDLNTSGIKNVHEAVLPVERSITNDAYLKSAIQLQKGDIYPINFEGYGRNKKYERTRTLRMISTMP